MKEDYSVNSKRERENVIGRMEGSGGEKRREMTKLEKLEKRKKRKKRENNNNNNIVYL